MCCDQGGSSAPPSGDNKFTDTLADISSKQEARAESLFQPMEDRQAQDVNYFNSAAYSQKQQDKAAADVDTGFATSRATTDANLSSMGANPNDGAYSTMARGLTVGQGAAKAAAVTGAADQAQMTGYNTLSAFSGRGQANVGAAIQAGQAGGNIYAQNVSNGLKQEDINNQGAAGMGQMVGTGLSVAAMFL